MRLKAVDEDGIPVEVVEVQLVVERTPEPEPVEQLTLEVAPTVPRKHPLARCESCLLYGETYVPSAGPQYAEVAIVGEAPGGAEARGGVPFSGPSGQLLNTVLKHHGIQRADCFVTNVVLCRPPENRTPSKKEIACCSERLQSEIDSVRPTHILALGNTATSAIIAAPTKITKFRAGPPKESPRFPGIKVVPSIHPAACLRATDSFPSLVADVGKLLPSTVSIAWEPPKYTAFDDPSLDRKILTEILNSRYEDLVVDIETAHDKDAGYEHPNQYKLLCVGLSYRTGTAVVIGGKSLPDAEVRRLLAQLLKQKRITAHNGKFDIQGLTQVDAELTLFFDTMLASYCLDERQGTHGLEYLSVEVLGSPLWKNMMPKNYADADSEELHRYNAIDCHNEFALKDHYEATLGADSKKLHAFLVRLSNALVQVELEGIGVDLPYLERLKDSYSGTLAQLEEDLSDWVANPRSPKQVGEALQKLGVPFVKTTDAMFLETVANRQSAPAELREFCRRMLKYRKEQKIFGTYVSGADKRLFEGRLYPTILLHGTTTGRPSCRNPNLFNIPRGSTLRNMFVADPGNVFVQCDYSQIELRVVTCEAQEPYFADIFRDPSRDTHQEVASRLGIERQRAKMVVYGLSYEMSAAGLAYRLGIPLNEASRYVHEFHNVIPQIVKWKEGVKRRVLHEGADLITPFGRHRRFWLITDNNREDVVKEAIAFYPQSIASDICATALCQLVEDGLKVRLSVYDSIMVECPEADAVEVGKHMENRMREAGRAYSEYVPFAVDTKIGRSWGDFG